MIEGGDPVSHPITSDRHLTLGIGMRLGYADFFSSPCTPEAVIARLQRYSLSEVLDYLGRISALLYTATDNEPHIQQVLCRTFFGGLARHMWSKVQQEVIRSGSLVVLFDEAAVNLTVKFALHALPSDGNPTGAHLSALGEAVLMCGTLIDATPLTPTDPLNTEVGWNRWVYYHYVLGLATTKPQLLQSLARTYEIYLTDQSHLRTHPDWIDLPALVTRKTGLSPEQLWAVLFSFLSYFLSIQIDNVDKRRALIDRRNYFAEFGFTESESQQFFELLGQDANRTQIENRAHFSLTELRPYDNFPIARRPFLAVGESAFCPSVRFLFERTTDGLYHDLLNSYPDDASGRRDRARFQRYVGAVYEDYIDRLFRRAIAASPSKARPIYLGPAALRQAIPPIHNGAESPVCDHVIAYEGAIVLLDSKAKFMPLRVRSGLDESTFIGRFEDLIIGAARQLDATIHHIRSGHLAQLGVNATPTTRFHPVVCSLADYPLQPLVSEWIERRVNAANLLRTSGTRPLELLQADHVEAIEEVMGAGRSLADVLEAKAQDEHLCRHSFNTFAYYETSGSLRRTRSPHLEARYLALVEQAKNFLREREQSSQT